MKKYLQSLPASSKKQTAPRSQPPQQRPPRIGHQLELIEEDDPTPLTPALSPTPIPPPPSAPPPPPAPVQPTPIPRRYPQRNRAPPQRFAPYVEH